MGSIIPLYKCLQQQLFNFLPFSKQSQVLDQLMAVKIYQVSHFTTKLHKLPQIEYILRKYPELDECISVFAREDRDHVGTDTNWDKDLITVITRTIGITTTQISVNDEEIQSLLCELNNIKYIPIHLPADMLDEMYDNDSEEVTAFSKASAELAQSILNTDHMA